MHLKQPGQPHLPEETKFLGQMGLVRWLYGTFPPQTIQIRKGRVLYVIPHYPDPRYRLLQAEQEAHYLEQMFQAKAIEPQSKSVRQLLESGNFDLLHFAGHGIAEQGNIGNAKLLMQGRIEGSKYILDHLSATTIEQYSNLKSEADKNRPMVVLNACQIGREGYVLTSIGGFAQAFLNSGAGAFVGPLWSVGDRPARIFTETFYKGLMDGLTLSEATIRAREQAKQAGDATWLAYAVYGHPNLKVKVIDERADSELTVRGKIRNASAIFVHGTPAPDVIQGSLSVLKSSLAWATQHRITELENDALWGIYLCNSRLNQPSEAADALIQLRENLEGMRRGIRDPFKRGGVFSTYRYLFNALCEHLQKAGRAEDLLEAIESSKGRVIADRLTEQSDAIVSDKAIYDSVKRLPDLTQQEGFHYLTYFVDEERVYAAFVSKQGIVYAIDPIPELPPYIYTTIAENPYPSMDAPP